MRPITRLTTAVTVLAAVLATSATGLQAQEKSMVRWAKCKNPEAQAYVEKGDGLLGEQRYMQARTEYESAVEIMRNDGDFPSPALYRIAASYYYEGKFQTAAYRFDQLAAESTVFGDLVMQLWAIADAAWIYGMAGNKLGVDERVERLMLLLKSPYIPDEVRAEITAKRLGEITTLTGS